jgi:hypothetical protein
MRRSVPMLGHVTPSSAGDSKLAVRVAQLEASLADAVRALNRMRIELATRIERLEDHAAGADDAPITTPVAAAAQRGSKDNHGRRRRR